ncbi:hypothetical protein [Candidatus Viridilinea mediisalina]|uniref:hypothetical protein n=1 Tax=Candidatus Viridilinea mediisalina TaxID=2024553 RepID=UPI000F5B69A2|nr:hypothetical protein [Candidatus Viridilinea mediisalina]
MGTQVLRSLRPPLIPGQHATTRSSLRRGVPRPDLPNFRTSYRCPAPAFGLDWLHQQLLSSWSLVKEVMPPNIADSR